MSDRASGKGQSLVEFSLVLPLFLLLIFGVIDGGRLIYTFNTVSNAARDGARVAIVNQSTSGTATCDTTSATAWSKGCAIQSGLVLNLAPGDVTVAYRNATDSGDCASPPSFGCLAVVTVTGTYTPLTPVLSQIIGTVSVESTSTMPIERVCTNPTLAPIPHC